ncbi:hypothetical protein B0H16DRAFT_112286 [Mycena metata]|uniref:Uncharacterized protein n=1 Tax=Mycena metata TaxID=1033252 RepID=A0AAD7I9E8_9AGAR|nr:hypothetical protein B0H16DRAFT_112286 [Mycena metata]
MATANQILNLFANSGVLCNVPHIQENVLAECDNLAQLALSHTCVLYREIYDDLRISKIELGDVAFDVRDPDVVLISHYTAKKDTPSARLHCMWNSDPNSKYLVKKVRKPATEKELAAIVIKKQVFICLSFELWAPPPGISEAEWYSDDGYKGIMTPGGVVLSKCRGVYDSMFGGGNIEYWKIPESSTKMGFTVADYRDLYVGRYKKEKKGGSPHKIYSKYWKSGGKSVIISCMPDNMHGTLVFCDSQYE